MIKASVYTGLFLLFFSFSARGAVSDISGFQIPEALHQSLEAALEKNYNLRYTEALDIFKTLEPYEEEHPMVAFGPALTHWWRLSVMVLERDKDESRPFLEAVKKAVKIAEEKISKGDPTGSAHLAKGAALGLLGRWHASNRHWVRAYFTGKKARRYLKKSRQINPDLDDALLGLGIFDYYVATLPGVVRLLAFAKAKKDPEKGLQELEQAARHGLYAKTAAKLMLSLIYLENEEKPEMALPYLTELIEQYPLSPYVRSLYFIALYNAGRMDEFINEAERHKEFLDTAQIPQKYAAQVYFCLGSRYFKEMKWEKAAEQYALAIQNGQEKDPFYTWAHLYLGKVYDAMEERRKAEDQYKTVLTMTPRLQSHHFARKYLGRQFKGNKQQVKNLRF